MVFVVIVLVRGVLILCFKNLVLGLYVLKVFWGNDDCNIFVYY